MSEKLLSIAVMLSISLAEIKKKIKWFFFWMSSIFDHLPNLEWVLQVAVALVPPASDLEQILGVEHCQVASWEFGC